MNPAHARARLSLEGLSVGDAFGERFFVNPAVVGRLIAERAEPRPPWTWTDDTAMAISVVEVLERSGAIDQDALAWAFAQRYAKEPDRDYGPGARDVLTAVLQGTPWKEASTGVFGGQGSLGNGSAMRAPPLGAYLCDQPERVIVEEAARSSEVTHAHPEGKAGAIAVALAAAWAARHASPVAPSLAMLEYVAAHTPPSQVKDGVGQALGLLRGPSLPTAVEAAAVLGNGKDVTCMDTVPFSLWAAARYSRDFREAIWTTVSALGDRDTTCAIVGGIVVLTAGQQSIPPEWLAAREPLP